MFFCVSSVRSLGTDKEMQMELARRRLAARRARTVADQPEPDSGPAQTDGTVACFGFISEYLLSVIVLIHLSDFKPSLLKILMLHFLALCDIN